MDILELKKNKAIEAYENGTKKERLLLERLYGKNTFLKDVTQRIKDLNDAINELGESDIEVKEYRKLQSIDAAIHILGNQEAVIIAKALNEGWIADPLDQSQYKYTAYFIKGPSGLRYYDYDGWSTLSTVGSRLCLKDAKTAKHFGSQFIEIHKKYILKSNN